MRINRKLTGNMLALGFLQISNYVFPFLTVPYLSRILSTSHYGLILFSLSFTTYFTILCDYGFNFSATKQIALYAQNQEKINRIVSAVTAVKIILLFLSVCINIIVVFSVVEFSKYWYIYVLNLFILLNNAFFPNWFFQGMEKMRYITLIQVIIRLLNVLLIFILIHNDSQFYLWPIINAIGAILSIVFAQWVLFTKFNIRYVRPFYYELKAQFVDGWYIFISTLAISFYTVSNSFLLGVLTNTTMVAFYASGEKIMNAVQGVLGPISQALFPHLSKIVNDDKLKGIKHLQKAFWGLGLLGLLTSMGLFVFAPFIVNLLFGAKYLIATTNVLRILAVLPFIICLSNILGIQTMLSFGLNKPFAKILIISGITNVIGIGVLVPKYTYVGSAISVVISECLVTIMMFVYLYRNGIIVWFGQLKKVAS